MVSRPDVERSRLDRAFEALSESFRRRILLEIRAGQVETEEDLVQLAGEERPTIALRHVHLPQLAEWGYIEWNRDTGAVSKGPSFPELEAVLDVLNNDQDDLSAPDPD